MPPAKLPLSPPAGTRLGPQGPSPKAAPEIENATVASEGRVNIPVIWVLQVPAVSMARPSSMIGGREHSQMQVSRGRSSAIAAARLSPDPGRQSAGRRHPCRRRRRCARAYRTGSGTVRDRRHPAGNRPASCRLGTRRRDRRWGRKFRPAGPRTAPASDRRSPGPRRTARSPRPRPAPRRKPRRIEVGVHQLVPVQRRRCFHGGRPRAAAGVRRATGRRVEVVRVEELVVDDARARRPGEAEIRLQRGEVLLERPEHIGADARVQSTRPVVEVVR